MSRKFVDSEPLYQKAQEKWEKDRNDRYAYSVMWELMYVAVYNSMRKSLKDKIPHERIVERSKDITVRIFSSINRKRNKGKPWKIGKLSSYVYNACLWRFNEKWKMEDLIEYRDTPYGDKLNKDGTDWKV